MRRAHQRRLQRLEQTVLPTAPTFVFSDRPLEDGEAEELLENWQEVVARGEGSLCGQTLFILSPDMSLEEWMQVYGGGAAV